MLDLELEVMGEELLWAIKNGDIDAVKKAYEKVLISDGKQKVLASNF